MAFCRKILVLVSLLIALFSGNELGAQVSADAVISTAKQYLGTPYRSGGNTPRGFCCSGFTRFVFGKFGYNLNGSAPGQYSHGRSVSSSELQPGDLVFFGGRRNSKSIGHVGIVTEADNAKGTFKFIHSATSSGICISSSAEPYYKGRYVGARRILDKAPAGGQKNTSHNATASGGAVAGGTVDVYSPAKQAPSKIHRPQPLSATERQRHENIARQNAVHDSINDMYRPVSQYHTHELTPVLGAEDLGEE